MMKIPVAKPFLNEEEAQSAYNTIMSGWVTQGPRVQEFEEKFAKYTGSKFAVAVSNCTTALHLSLLVSGINRGDEVICPSLSYIATANAIVHAGGIPVFADVDPNTSNIDPVHTEKLITQKTKAILVVHQVGIPCDIDAFKLICKKHNLKLIEDAACAAGSSYKGQKIGSHSDLVCFSFHPRKVITTGDGGMICTGNEEYYDRLKLLRQHGMSINDRLRHESGKVMFEEHIEVGYNYRMTDIQAAVGINQLEKLDMLVEERSRIANRYLEAFSKIASFELPSIQEGSTTNWQSFIIRLKENSKVKRDELMQLLLDKGISTRRGIMTAHREKAYNHYPKVNLPVSEAISDNSITLPLYFPMKKEEIEFVIDMVTELL